MNLQKSSIASALEILDSIKSTYNTDCTGENPHNRHFSNFVDLDNKRVITETKENKLGEIKLDACDSDRNINKIALAKKIFDKKTNGTKELTIEIKGCQYIDKNNIKSPIRSFSKNGSISQQKKINSINKPINNNIINNGINHTDHNKNKKNKDLKTGIIKSQKVALNMSSSKVKIMHHENILITQEKSHDNKENHVINKTGQNNHNNTNMLKKIENTNIDNIHKVLRFI